MVALTSNQNYLQPTGFKVVIDRENYPNLEFFAQSVNHPDVSMSQPAIPFRRIENVALPGDTISYGDLSVSFILDEDMKSYREMHSWMRRILDQDNITALDRFKNNIDPISKRFP